MLPLSLLKCACDVEVEIELKNGASYRGTLVNLDVWMNVILKNVTQSSKEGIEVCKLEEIYVRGNTIKFIKVPEMVVDKAEEERQAREQGRKRRDNRNRQRNRHGGRGRDRERGGRRGGRINN